ncbi:hypothetical protein BZG36_05642 [Bifiguratus adelaidae]|uniref:Uncharacterized protein n=1 Tax=Bifiguratus adelaidae TaxID=1938954 RepID=A0A261XSQ6_9FUNG|nr:hypothetical protein BZG36_05642 [Bifiguratus adelaidae]
MPTNTMQSTTALGLVRSGVCLQFLGLFWGIVVPLTPYPRIGLAAHIQFMGSGAMVLLAGILLHQPSIIELGSVQSRIVYWGFATVWFVIASECANAFWGANQMMAMAAASAGAKGAAPWQEQVVNAAHIFPSIGLILAFGVLLKELFAQRKEMKLKE